jgi:hypothetical protein
MTRGLLDLRGAVIPSSILGGFQVALDPDHSQDHVLAARRQASSQAPG